MANKVTVHHYDIEELACAILDLDYDKIDADTEVIEDALYSKFDMTLDQFQDIVQYLLPLIDVGTSPLTGKKYKGFSIKEKQVWLVKTEI